MRDILTEATIDSRHQRASDCGSDSQGQFKSFQYGLLARRKNVGGSMLTSIAGRSVIVTGASKGIGKGIANVFCRNGGKVLVVSRNLEEADACAEELRR